MLNEALQLLHSPIAWILYFFCAFLMGLAKTGIQNIGSIAVPIFAFLFGAKESTGIVLILLAMSDLMSVIYYRKQLIWSEVLKLLPMALFGLVFAIIIGKYIDDKTFKIVMASCILFGVGIMFWTEHVHESQKETLSNGKWYSPVFGFIMGFSTMIGNAAGPALSVYLLSRKMDKFTFVATGAWFIMILNYVKIPLQIFVWHNVTWAGLLLNLMAIPFIILGGITGIKLLKKLPERRFKRIIQILVIISSVLMFFF
ncbi:sulfite exporter TauE/SafE family protein [Parapedobacter sp. SGR-10]|uniref:sulfite exporter TauE/SafE family protein n=1 Tax=Parapedobacter sp. SGR-10 TaxID=2710879 RepID=UPI0013D86102|nr:sulfite exporter TauE/SafE family protein [Parapedobacter sp. SGR-10]NGF55788.1 sulfite exporter TauE/SafE family protein [Parapedobacter sp. SGR-10]